MSFNKKIIEYAIVFIFGVALFGVAIPKLISAQDDILSITGIVLLVFGIAVALILIKREVEQYVKTKKDEGDENGQQ